MSSLSFRIEAADANAHKLRTALAVTEAAIPIPMLRAAPPRLSRDVSASRDHNVTEPVTPSVGSLSEQRSRCRGGRGANSHGGAAAISTRRGRIWPALPGIPSTGRGA